MRGFSTPRTISNFLATLLCLLPAAANADVEGTAGCFAIFNDQQIVCIGPQSSDLCAVPNVETAFGSFFARMCEKRAAAAQALSLKQQEATACNQQLAQLAAQKKEAAAGESACASKLTDTSGQLSTAQSDIGALEVTNSELTRTVKAACKRLKMKCKLPKI